MYTPHNIGKPAVSFIEAQSRNCEYMKVKNRPEMKVKTTQQGKVATRLEMKVKTTQQMKVKTRPEMKTYCTRNEGKTIILGTKKPR